MNANLEEAANVATEYLSSLENLPNEAQHILMEIRHRDMRAQDLADDIRRETQKYFRHSSKNAGQPLSGKDVAIPDTVSALYSEVDTLAAEKVALADRLVKIFERAMARLQHDLQRILKLQGDDPGLPPTQHFLSTVDNTMQQLQTTLRAATAAVDVPPVSAPIVPPPPKKRRVAATASAGSIKLPSPVPVSASTFNTGSVSTLRSALSRQVHPRQSPTRTRRVHALAGLDDEDAEGEEDMDEPGEDGAEGDDQELYCFCQKLSYGEMIACDNEDCQYQWFHISCVNVKAPLPDTWYCEECKAKLGIIETFTPVTLGVQASSAGRKGRKKQ